MEASILFKLCNLFALTGWLLLIIFPNWKYTSVVVLNVVIATLAFLYTILIISTIKDFDINSFSTFNNVKKLFENDIALTAGWIHYLAFDLFVGLFIVNEGKKLNFPRWQYTMCLPFTFMFGPIGLVLFLIIKQIKK